MSVRLNTSNLNNFDELYQMRVLSIEQYVEVCNLEDQKMTLFKHSELTMGLLPDT